MYGYLTPSHTLIYTLISRVKALLEVLAIMQYMIQLSCGYVALSTQ